jgi:hypothetical protein
LLSKEFEMNPEVLTTIAYVFATAAIVVMGIDLFKALKLKKAIVGGEVGQKWNFLTTLIVIFFVFYLFAPLILVFDLGQYMPALTFFVFLFGAVFVLVVIGIITEALSFLDLLKE